MAFTVGAMLNSFEKKDYVRVVIAMVFHSHVMFFELNPYFLVKWSKLTDNY